MDLNEIELDLLREDQIIGSNRLEIFDQIGTKAAITDYAIALGGIVSLNKFTKGRDNQLEYRAGYYWTKTHNGRGSAISIGYYNMSSTTPVDVRNEGIRVALPYSAISKIASNEVICEDGVVQLEAGYLPKKIASKQLQKELERIYDKKKRFLQKDITLKSIHKNYIVDSKSYQSSEKFDPEQLDEMELINGKKYTRVIIKPRFTDEPVTFSDGQSYQVGDAVWIERYPVIWYKDLKKDIVFNKDIIVSGVPFDHEKNYTGDFSKTDMYEYLNTYLKGDLFSSYLKDEDFSKTDMYEHLNTYLKGDLFSSLKDADFESKQAICIQEIERLQNINLFLEDEIKIIQQQIDKNNQDIENYGKLYLKERKNK